MTHEEREIIAKVRKHTESCAAEMEKVSKLSDQTRRRAYLESSEDLFHVNQVIARMDAAMREHQESIDRLERERSDMYTLFRTVMAQAKKYLEGK